jgi:hypothetical protein
MTIVTQNMTLPQKEVRNLNQYNIIFLIISLVIWICVPIVGIFPLLLSVQLNLLTSKNSNKSINLLNNIVLILVVFTICIFFTSYPIYADVAIYVQSYEKFNTLNPFEAAASYGTGIEFIPLLIAYFVYYLTNGSVYAYLLSNALIINILVVFVISKRLVPKYYPILLMVAFSTPHYYWQAIIYRHSLSNTFLIAAIAFIESESSSILFVSLLIVAFFSHVSNIINIATLIFIKLSTSINDNNKRVFRYILTITKPIIIIITLIFTIVFFFNSGQLSLSIILPFITPLIDANKSSILQARLSRYDNYSVVSGYDLEALFVFGCMQVNILIFIFKKNIPLKNLSLAIIYSIQFIAYIYASTNSTSWRVYFLLVSMYGFLYMPNVEIKISKNKVINNMKIIVVLIALAYNFYRLFSSLTQGWIVAEEHVFFNGVPLQMNLLDYIIFMLNATPN